MYQDRGWYKAALLVAGCGHAVTVLDPDADDEIDRLWTGDPGHGVITIVRAESLTCWQFSVAEELPTVEAMQELLDMSAEPTVDLEQEDDGEID